MPLDNMVALITFLHVCLHRRRKCCMIQHKHSQLDSYVWDKDQLDFTMGGAAQCDAT